MQYNETQLAELIKDVEREFTTALVKAEEDAKASLEVTEVSLAKAEEEKPEPKKDEKPEEKQAEPAAEGDKKPEAEASEEKPAAEAKPEGEAAPQSDQGHDYDAEDMEHLTKMYMSMSKAELMVHHDACKMALDKCGESAMAQESAPMAKSEEIKAIEVKAEVVASPEVGLLKSELEAANAKYEELKKNFDGVASFLGKLLETKAAPAAKAITSLDAIAKSESGNEDKTFTKSQVHEILCKKSSEPSLQKSDRDAINVYYAEGQVNVTGISHLLK